ncbi:MAG: hypothetical protein Q9M91_01365 [Candidatus Dojkabacteria bacterium]|nr:hypothetical protein [Candidatus Dojkabacteria bacterium]MDQ7020473.1 hypothetical protein [Candidatus Dojkabacteria bacterium]
MKQLIKKLRSDLYAKPIPGVVLNDLMEVKLKKLAKKYKHDSEALWIGSYVADLFIVEARRDTGNHMNHLPIASEYAKNELFPNYNFTDHQQEIILEIIEKHHSSEEKKYIETKLFTNADCFKFLEPKGAFHLFGAVYGREGGDFKKAIDMVMFKAQEKYDLVDLDKETIVEATLLYDKLMWMLERSGAELLVPEVYKD